jgi:hypothetical protein
MQPSGAHAEWRTIGVLHLPVTVSRSGGAGWGGGVNGGPTKLGAARSGYSRRSTSWVQHEVGVSVNGGLTKLGAARSGCWEFAKDGGARKADTSLS